MESIEKVAIGFSGGKESIKLVRQLKHKNPILLTYLPNDDTRGLRALFRYFAKNEKLKIHIIYGKKKEFNETIIHDDDGQVVDYNNPLLKKAKSLGIQIFFMGRRKIDFPSLKEINKPNITINRIKMEFPLWNE